MPNFDTLAPGPEPIAAYQPIFELGRGGMGTVHLARAVGAGGFERLVVIKRLKQDLIDSPEAVRRFLDEARHAALIHHANVVGIHQIGRDREGYFLVLDYVEGGSLHDLVVRAKQRGQSVPVSIALRVALDALAGLSAAHAATDASGRPLGMLHRDVSPQNLLVGRDGVSRLADFGVAKSALASVQTDQRYLVGKLLYLAPEYLARKPVGPTLDIYALGVTLWAAISGSEPWPDATEAELVTLICQERVPSLKGVGVRVAPQIEALVMRACAPDAPGRFQTAREMADEIEFIARETGWVASHADVAALLDELIGKDLVFRRERVASIVARLPRPDSASDRTHRSVPPAAEPSEATQRIAREVRTEGVEVPVTRRRPLVLGASAVSAVLLAAGVSALVGRGGRETPDSAASAAASVEPITREISEPAPETPAVTAVPSVAPSAPAPTSVPESDARNRSRANPSASHSRAARSAPAAPRASAQETPAPAPTVAPVVAPSPKAPDSISKSNPYR